MIKYAILNNKSLKKKFLYEIMYLNTQCVYVYSYYDMGNCCVTFFGDSFGTRCIFWHFQIG
jgi:hypothetical protein